MIVAIVQARMGSNRFPGKVMKKVLGKPLIGYLLERLSRAERIDKIILATSTNKENDILCNYVSSLGYDVFRGSEDDVLERYCQAAKTYGAKTVVRITGDCPLIDPNICDKLIRFYFKEKVDYVKLSSRYAEGIDCEVVDFDALKKARNNARKNSEREHVTPYIKNNSNVFKVKVLENKYDEGKYRFTIDEPEDFEVIKRIIKDLSKTYSKFIDFAMIKEYLDNHPNVFKINAKIPRNEGYLKCLKKEEKGK